MPSKAAGQRRRPMQERARETRQHILDTAARLFGERGIENTSTNRIAAEAGTSIGTVYRYFSDRTVMVEELLEQLLESIERRFTERLNLSDKTVEVLVADILATICDELVVNAKLVRALAAGVQFYNSGIPEFEPRLRLLVKVLLIQILGPADDHELDIMAFVLVNTGFSAVLRASALEVEPEHRREAIDMTARMIGAWSIAEIERRRANSS